MHYPEYDPFSQEDWARIMAQYGCILLRQALPLEPLSFILSRAQPVFEQMDQRQAAGKLSAEDQHQLYFGHVHIKHLHLPESLVPQLIKQTAITQVLRQILGPQFAIINQNTAPRRQDPFMPDRAIPYHQDIEFLGPLGGTAYNCWIPLTPAGNLSPTVELIVSAQDESYYGLPCNLSMARPIGQQRQDFRDLYSRFSRSLFWQPELQPGDVLIFHYLTLHRTLITPTMIQPRYDFEIRLTDLLGVKQGVSDMLLIDLDS